MTQKENYALEWNKSAQFFYDHNSYKHLSDQIRKYKTVLEIGCGTGQSTLALLEAGHAVIAVDQNPYCIVKAKQLIEEFGYTITEDITKISPRTVCFIECDVTDMSFEQNILPNISPDIVICWNIGSYWDKAKLNDAVPKMIEYGLTPEQISANTESSYGELVFWRTCAIAKAKNCAVHLVDRGMQKITRFNDPYYVLLKKEFSFKKIKYVNTKATTLSKGGRQLISNGKVNTQNEMPIIFISILMA